jgi:hypothetical protein
MMPALGQKRTYAVQKGMSALPPKADICSAKSNVRFGPEADIDLATQSPHRQWRVARAAHLSRELLQSSG